MIKLGTIVKDTATGLRGMLTIMRVDQGNVRYYHFQPRGLNPEDGQPLNRYWLVADRIEGGIQVPDPEDLPLSALGTDVEDLASGFSGMAIAIALHLSGCVHVDVQPSGTLKKTGGAIASEEFDIRRLKGRAVKKLSDAEIEADRKNRPSPGPSAPFHLR